MKILSAALLFLLLVTGAAGAQTYCPPRASSGCQKWASTIR